MNETQKQLDSIVKAYYNDLINTDITPVKDHKYSEKYQRRIKEAFAVFDTIKNSKPHKIRRRIILAIIIAALIGTITVAAYEPARKFFLSIFSNHTEVTPAEDISVIDNHKTTIEKKYAITVPKDYEIDKESSVETEIYIIRTYYNTDKTKSIMFNQYVKEAYYTSIDNQKSDLNEKTDQKGQVLLVHNTDDMSVSIIWDNGEYIFELFGEMTEAELMEIYYTVK